MSGLGFQAARHRGGSHLIIKNDAQLNAAQKAVRNLQQVLLDARKVHSAADYRTVSEPILPEIQQREQEILECLSRSEAEA